jgi:hypothetical protein
MKLAMLFTLKLTWVCGRFASLAGSSQTLFEMSNGFNTEHVYMRRRDDSRDIVVGVVHTSGTVKREFSTSLGSAIKPDGLWQHVCWTVQHILPMNLSAGSVNSTSAILTLLPESLFWSSLPTSYSTSTSYVAAQAMSSFQVRSCPVHKHAPP